MNNMYEMQPVDTAAVQTSQQQWTEQRSEDYALAETDAFRDLLRAGLAKQAMDNTAVLAKFEEHYNSIAPCGCAEYRFIVQSYVKAAMECLMERRW